MQIKPVKMIGMQWNRSEGFSIHNGISYRITSVAELNTALQEVEQAIALHEFFNLRVMVLDSVDSSDVQIIDSQDHELPQKLLGRLQSILRD